MILESIITLQNLFIVFIIIVFLVYWIFTFIIFYHLTRFGIGTLPKKIATIFLMGSVVLFCLNFLFFSSINFNVLKDRVSLLVNNISKINN